MTTNKIIVTLFTEGGILFEVQFECDKHIWLLPSPIYNDVLYELMHIPITHPDLKILPLRQSSHATTTSMTAESECHLKKKTYSHEIIREQMQLTKRDTLWFRKWGFQLKNKLFLMAYTTSIMKLYSLNKLSQFYLINNHKLHNTERFLGFHSSQWTKLQSVRLFSCIKEKQIPYSEPSDRHS